MNKTKSNEEIELAKFQTKQKERLIKTANWLRAAFPNYEELLQAAAAFKISAQDLQQELAKHEEKINEENLIHYILALSDNPKYKKSSLLEHAISNAGAVDDNGIEYSKTANAIKKALLIKEEIYIEKKSSDTKLGGKAKARKVEQCRIKFIDMVDSHVPPWDKTTGNIAEAILELKPALIRHSKIHQNSVITANTNLPIKWLREYWGLEKRSYNKR
ncbi:hypothetical protein [Undibacterium umbellatum]|uniref:Uncharacterized protein n=1 Tax=Undibacterium umbellatum TaxID=2762300 RepID=A0ABR6ZBL7_9BURK|nr:hypothetical protein [Undibacterium umbellatum]MBC3909029.1 hypothetical protein [Undibacterium umbellatum]